MVVAYTYVAVGSLLALLARSEKQLTDVTPLGVYVKQHNHTPLGNCTSTEYTARVGALQLPFERSTLCSLMVLPTSTHVFWPMHCLLPLWAHCCPGEQVHTQWLFKCRQLPSV